MAADWQEGCERCKQIPIWRHGRDVVHSTNDSDHPSSSASNRHSDRRQYAMTHGSIGLITGLDPSMTGCGGWGRNITSDNISRSTPEHQATRSFRVEAGHIARRSQHDDSSAARRSDCQPWRPSHRRDAARWHGRSPPLLDSLRRHHRRANQRPSSASKRRKMSARPCAWDADCDRRTHDITPAARDLANEHRIFVMQSWPR